MNPTVIEIGGYSVGPNQPCLIIAEAGVNHNGSLDLAYQLIDCAVQAGADAVKFQTFKADLLVTSDAPKAAYQVKTTGGHETQYEMLRRLELSPEAHHELMAYAHQQNLLFLSTPFDEASANFLAELGVPAFKLSSGDLTNLPLLEQIARYGRPMLVSTGMATLAEVEAAVTTIEQAGNSQIVLLQCVSNYPAQPEDVNLRAMQTMAQAFTLPIGYSDHTLGLEVALAAVALGACVIEKHVTLDRTLPGPDHLASLEPEELSALVRGIRTVEAALGHGRKYPAPSEANTAAVARKSLVAAQDIPAGTALSPDLIAIRRPGNGLAPALLSVLLGKRVTREIKAGQLLSWEMLEY